MTAPPVPPKTKAAAIAEAWRALATRWPKRFAPARLDEIMRRTWERGLADCAIEALVPAAEQLAASWQGPAPDVPDLAKQARAYEARHLRATQLGSHATVPSRRRDPFDGARRFWVERVDGYGEVYRQTCWQLAHGAGCVGISETDAERIAEGTLAWGWIDP